MSINYRARRLARARAKRSVKTIKYRKNALLEMNVTPAGTCTRRYNTRSKYFKIGADGKPSIVKKSELMDDSFSKIRIPRTGFLKISISGKTYYYKIVSQQLKKVTKASFDQAVEKARSRTRSRKRSRTRRRSRTRSRR